MKGLKQFGAMALAAAMAVTMVAPMSVKAEVYDGATEVFDIDRTGSSTIIEGETPYDDDAVSRTYTSTVYKNRITGDSWNASTVDDNAEWKATHYYKERKKATIGTGEYRYSYYSSFAGEEVGKLKVTKGKGVVTIKEVGSGEYTDYPEYDSKTKEVYFQLEDHSRKVVATSDTWPTVDQMNGWKVTQHWKAFRIYAVKPGTAKLSIKVGDKKIKNTVTVADDARIFQKVTYAGQELSYNLDGDQVWGKSKNANGLNYVTKKSGKFRATMGKDYKFVKAFVIKSSPYVEKNASVDGWNYNWTKRQPTTGIDLNGDGDTLDTIYGLDERLYTKNQVQIIKKNGKKIKLDKITENEKKNISSASFNSKSSSKDNVAETTRVVVVYQNKSTKTYGTRDFYITYRKGSKK